MGRNFTSHHLFSSLASFSIPIHSFVFSSLIPPRSPVYRDKITVKRIIALPGDRVATRSPCPKPSQIVPWNHVWVEGDVDDSGKSFDSNAYGPVSMNLIHGNVMCVVCPRPRMLRWEDWGGDVVGLRQRARVQEDAVAVEAPPMA
jgi:inner membrane protease subunit 2